jgi:hypothetical protein
LRPSVDDQAVLPHHVAEALIEAPGALVPQFHREAKNRRRASSGLLLSCQDQCGTDPLTLRSRLQSVHLGYACQQRPHLRIFGSKEQRDPANDLGPMPGEQVHRFLAQMTGPALFVVEHVEQRHIASAKDFHVLGAAWPNVDVHLDMLPAFPRGDRQSPAPVRRAMSGSRELLSFLIHDQLGYIVAIVSSDFPDPMPAGSSSGPTGYQSGGAYSAFPGGYQGPGQAADYGTGVKAAGFILTVFVPWLALIAALVLRASEASSVRRASLRRWAVLSGVWLALGVLVPLIGLGVFASSVQQQVSHNGPCIGGPASGATGTPVGNGNFRFDCAGGGSTIVHLGN